MKPNSKTNFLTLGLVILAFGLWVFFIEYQSAHFSLPTPSPTRQVTTNSLGWVEKWRKPLLLVRYKEADGVVTDKTLIVPVQKSEGMRLLALDTASGQMIWEQEFDSKYGTFDAIAADADRVYLAASSTVRAFDIVDGHPLWTTPELYAHTSSEILPLEQNGTIQDQVFNPLAGATIFDIDSQNGVVTSAREYPLVLKLKTDAATYYMNHNFDLTSIDNQSGRTLWTVKTRGVAGRPALIDSSVLVFQSGPHLTKLVGLDPASGKTLWQTEEENLASNFVILNNAIYAMTTEPAIVAYDALTGQEAGQIEFSGGSFDSSYGLNWILADSSRAFVYLKDSQEVIAFEHK